MTTLEFYTALSALWIGLFWAPHILDRAAVRGLSAATDGRGADTPEQSDWARRSVRAHAVAARSFAAFGPLALLAMLRIPDDGYPGSLAIAYFLGLVMHYFVYALGIAVLRTLALLVMTTAILALALRIAGLI